MAETQGELLNAGEKAVLACQEPWPNSEEANTALNAFLRELYDLRVKHKVADVLVVIGDAYVTPEGEIAGVMTHFMCGRFIEQERLAAYAFGVSQTEREEAIGKLLAGKAVKVEKRKR